MSHEIVLDKSGEYSFAQVGGMPAWHKLGQMLAAGATVAEMRTAAHADFEAIKVPLSYANPAWKFGLKGVSQYIKTGNFGVVRSDDGTLLVDSCKGGWQAPDISEYFSLASEICEKVGATAETAGVLRDGQVVWIMCKMPFGYSVNGDATQMYFFMSMSIKYGMATRIDFTDVRIVCNNTLTSAINISDRKKSGLSISHRAKLDADMVRAMVGAAEEHSIKRKAQQETLMGAKPTVEQVAEYISKLFPLTSETNVRGKTLSLPAEKVLAVYHDDLVPGNASGEMDFWRLLNSVTYYADHIDARTEDSRMFKSFLGTTRAKKADAMNMALAMIGADSALADAPESIPYADAA